MDDLLEKEETMWFQRSRTNWLKDGDRNTTFFHSKASQRHTKKQIAGLEDVNGHWCTEPTDLDRIAVNFFQNLFSSSGPPGIDTVLDSIKPCVSPDMNQELSKGFTVEEVYPALFQMHPTKAPGPDGKPALFFQRFWPIVSRQVTEAVLGILNRAQDVSVVHETCIVMIPKVKRP